MITADVSEASLAFPCLLLCFSFTSQTGADQQESKKALRGNVAHSHTSNVSCNKTELHGGY